MKFNRKEVSNAIKEKIFKPMAEEVIEESKENLEELKAIAIGNLVNSDIIEELDNGYRFGFEAPYAEDVEYGMEPKRVSANDLYEWLEAKQQRWGGNLTQQQMVNLSHVIKKKIEAKGTEPKPYFRKALFEVIDKYEK